MTEKHIWPHLPEKVCKELRAKHDGWPADVIDDIPNYRLLVAGIPVTHDQAFDFIQAWRKIGCWTLWGNDVTV